MASFEPLSALDTLFVYLESPRTPMHIGSVAIFEGEPFRERGRPMAMGAIRDEIEHRLDLVPKLRRRLRFPRVGGTAPVWVDDAAFDIAFHVRHVALPAPGSEAELVELSAQLLAVPLDRGHPLWELWFVDGLTGGRVAIVEKLHHALADGLAGVELATVLLDFERHPQPARLTAPPWSARRQPRPVTVAARELIRRGAEPARAARAAIRAAGDPVHGARHAAQMLGALGTLATPEVFAPHSSLNVAVGQARRMAFVRQPLDSLRDVERRFGVTINDVLLAAVAGGLRAQLAARGEPVDEGATLQVLVPVGTDPHGDHRLGNKVSALIVRLPVGLSDPVARLVAVSRTTKHRKDQRQALAGTFLARVLDAWPRWALVGVARLIQRQPFVNLVVTNVPGPAVPLYAWGARMLEAFPFLPLAGNLSLGVAAFSYDGQLSVGVIADRDRCPDLDVVVDGIGRSFADMVAAAPPIDERRSADEAPLWEPPGRRRTDGSVRAQAPVPSGVGHRVAPGATHPGPRGGVGRPATPAGAPTRRRHQAPARPGDPVGAREGEQPR